MPPPSPLVMGTARPAGAATVSAVSMAPTAQYAAAVVSSAAMSPSCDAACHGSARCGHRSGSAPSRRLLQRATVAALLPAPGAGVAASGGGGGSSSSSRSVAGGALRPTAAATPLPHGRRPACFICFEASADAVFMECGHAGMCTQCAHTITHGYVDAATGAHSRGAGTCPVCRNPVTQVLRIGPDVLTCAGTTVAQVLPAFMWAGLPADMPDVGDSTGL